MAKLWECVSMLLNATVKNIVYCCLYVFITLVTIIYLFIHNIVLRNSLNNQNDYITSKEKELGKALTEIKTQKELNKVNINNDLKTFIKERNLLVQKVGKLEAELKTSKDGKTTIKIVYKNIPTSSNNTNKNLFNKNTLYKSNKDGTELKELEKLDIMYTDFRIDLDAEVIKQTINYKLHQRFNGEMIETLDKENKRIDTFLTLNELDENDKVVAKLKLNNFKIFTLSQEPRKEFNWFNPKLDLQVGVSLLNSSASLFADTGISIMSYGLTKDDIEFRFIRFGLLGYTSNEFLFSFSPIQYNIGKIESIPLISNLWITPSYLYKVNTNRHSIGLGLSVVF